MNTELEDSLADALRAKANAVPPSRMPALGRPAPARRGRLVPLVAAAVAAVAIGAAVIVLAPDDAVPDHAASTPVKVATPGQLAAGEVYYSLRLTSQAGGQAIMEKQLWQPRQRTGEWRQQMAQGKSIENGRVVPAGRVEPRPGGKCYPAYEVTDENCTAPASWLNPTVEFLANAPRDPATIGEQFHAAAVAELGSANQSDDLAYLVELHMIGELLAGNGVPPELSSALRQVVAAMPGIEVTDGVANLTGAQGTGYSLHKPNGDPLTVIFKADNTYLGSPTESIRHGIAPGLGQPPSRMLD
jgi:hypothetical protein